MFEKNDRVMVLKELHCCAIHDNIREGSVGVIRQTHNNMALVRLDISPHGKYNAYAINQFSLVKI